MNIIIHTHPLSRKENVFFPPTFSQHATHTQAQRALNVFLPLVDYTSSAFHTLSYIRISALCMLPPVLSQKESKIKATLHVKKTYAIVASISLIRYNNLLAVHFTLRPANRWLPGFCIGRYRMNNLYRLFVWISHGRKDNVQGHWQVIWEYVAWWEGIVYKVIWVDHVLVWT